MRFYRFDAGLAGGWVLGASSQLCEEFKSVSMIMSCLVDPGQPRRGCEAIKLAAAQARAEVCQQLRLRRDLQLQAGDVEVRQRRTSRQQDLGGGGGEAIAGQHKRLQSADLVIGFLLEVIQQPRLDVLASTRAERTLCQTN